MLSIWVPKVPILVLQECILYSICPKNILGSKAIAANLYSAFPVLLLPPLFPVGPIHPHLCISEAPQPKPNATLCTYAQSPSRQAPLGCITPPSKRQKKAAPAAEYEMQTVRKCDQKPRVFRLFCACAVYIPLSTSSFSLFRE